MPALSSQDLCEDGMRGLSIECPAAFGKRGYCGEGLVSSEDEDQGCPAPRGVQKPFRMDSR